MAGTSLNKAEAAAGYDRFQGHMQIAQRYLASNWYFAALEAAELAMSEEPAMCRHLRSVAKTNPKPAVRFTASVFLWTHLPVVLDHTVLDRIEQFQRDQRGTYRHSDQDLAILARQAKHQLDLAYRLWEYFSQTGRPSRSLDFTQTGDQSYAQGLCRTWIEMGVLRKEANAGGQVKWSRLGDEAGITVCRFCGRRRPATFGQFVDADQCDGCQGTGGPVWFGDHTAAGDSGGVHTR
jgi:hypothetical protein